MDSNGGGRDLDATLILLIYRHGLRASEACDLEWSQIDFDTATMHMSGGSSYWIAASTRSNTR